ncbi:hypothetical protein F5B21DRAFT_508914 [Xylaria acuta]|nr:hypothetical protein F5B21DRAFT_508914 [Xylaria acuta]
MVDNIWSKTCVLDSSCVFSPSNEHDITSALAIIKATKTKFSIRRGGHMPAMGAQSNDNGVLIALNNIDTKKFHDDKSVLSVGPGNRWIDVYNLTVQHGLAVVGGRYGHASFSYHYSFHQQGDLKNDKMGLYLREI